MNNLSRIIKLNPKFDFSSSVYKDEYVPIIFRCRVHGCICKCLPCSLYSRSFECLKCKHERKPESQAVTQSKDYYLTKAKAKHGAQYRYHRVTYHVNTDFPIPIYCTRCSAWQITTWYKHVKYGCICGRSKGYVAKNADAFKEASNMFDAAKRRNKGFKIVGEYTGFLDKVKVTCKVCGRSKRVGQQYVSTRLQQRCYYCKPKTYCGLQEVVLSAIERKSRLKFEREFAVSDNNFKVRIDGYNKRYNIGIEFHGDAWHGNPRKHKPRSKPNMFSTSTAYQLHKRTKDRERTLKALGYNLIVIWELDWNSDAKYVLTRVAKDIQDVKNTAKHRSANNVSSSKHRNQRL